MLTADEVAKVVSEVTGRIIERMSARAQRAGDLGAGADAPSLAELINETLWWELDRLKKADSDDEEARADKAFYASIRRELPRVSEAEQARLLERVVHRYANEIAGNFNPTFYKVATRVAPPMLSALLTGLSPRRLMGGQAIPSLDKHVIVEGDIANLARLREHGTLVVTPTHSSNLDSLILGFAIYHLGLPPLTYGAGLNLFRNPIIGKSMYNLGAYTVDRRKRDPLYKQTLKEYATVSLEFGQDNLFFPGGTRSRSGGVEDQLKKGLLGCSLAAYRNKLVHRRDRPKCFVVPCTISYPLVLEASTLIEDWLAEAGKSRYIIVDDEFSRWERWLDFLRGLFSLDLKIHLRFGKALDPFGNVVDGEGVSYDPKGRPIDPRGYLEVDGEVVADPVRDAEYTRALEGRIVDEFFRENLVHPTTVLAFACFELLYRNRRPRDLYRFLGSIGPEQSLAMPEVEDELDALLAELAELARADRLRLSPEVAAGDTRELIRAALRSFGTYHSRPVVQRKGVRLHIGDANLMFYYRNRLDGYGLRGAASLVHASNRGGLRG
ncbi:Bifunctional glycerol-3-phosphate dehydrogenase/glycerol-3-phosphate acyltransferase [Plesiocystis pacifica SIR-1]|uniref:Glycerol-3-phosphate acyltransferase n=1 Tax=Plesiocystis pacifica SIR-1 TaxID=391625 RepID=A6GD44_9BACT|nr:1-acyl-sn-glycerol-3-phosphate acyltransferase [Plesiocystis pacifica]EDM76202.1 Bifunctional glycerol-3-phosphate dehydrogenase/glycerol-3-phosphate acyltransferase [Plesiocystis pacifica SIR-1]